MSDRWKLYLVPWLGFVVALGMHLWHINRPATIVNDEVFFVNEGQDYVTGQAYFDPHPPLGKLQLGTIFTYFGFSPITWRVLNAIEGALIVPLLWWIVWRLTRRQTAATMVVILAVLDGFLLVESRLGLINVPYILYSLTALAGVLKALEVRRPAWWLLAAGTMIGAAISVKWLAGTIVAPAIIMWFWPPLFGQQRKVVPARSTQLIALASFTILPAAIYWFVFFLHFRWLGLPLTFWSTNQQMLNYHLAVPASGDPYAAPWWGWLLLWQPFLQWHQNVGQQVSQIWSIPNPWIWWTGAVFFLNCLVTGWRQPILRWLNIFLLATWLPFAFIRRIMYGYHAMPFDLFLIILVAVLLARWWEQDRWRVMVYLAVATLVFAWFLPWYLNLPLSSCEQQWRQWLPEWHVKTAQALRPGAEQFPRRSETA